MFHVKHQPSVGSHHDVALGLGTLGLRLQAGRGDDVVDHLALEGGHRLELACRSQLGAMACNTPLRPVAREVLEETWNNYQPGTRRPYGVMEWPALLRKLDRMDPGYAT